MHPMLNVWVLARRGTRSFCHQGALASRMTRGRACRRANSEWRLSKDSPSARFGIKGEPR